MRTLLAGLFLAAVAFAQKKDPVKPPDAATIQKIKDETAKLKAAVAEAAHGITSDYLSDVEVYVKAAEWIVKHNEWYTNDSAKQTFAVIAEGMKRAEAAKEGKKPWLEVEGRYVARGYRSRIDGSIQPYGVILPPGFERDPKKKWPLHIHLHGRDGSLTEVKHLFQHAETKATPRDQDYVQINVYGRGNNAYRWAGEEDLQEAPSHFIRTAIKGGNGSPIQHGKTVLEGFSMGGAGTWHYGLRRPDRFAVIQPGAGFTTTHGYIAKLPDPLPDYQEKCLTIYDAFRYAENAFNVPIVAYSGANDKQKAAADLIESELARLKLSNRLTHVVAPGLEHKFPPEWQKKVDTEVKQRVEADRGPFVPNDLRIPVRAHVKFTTYTLKNPSYHWLWITGLERHYERAAVDATWTGDEIVATTTNVTRLSFHPPAGTRRPTAFKLDGQALTPPPTAEGEGQQFAKGPDGWKHLTGKDTLPGPVKRPAVQGPIDDAFVRNFLCVVGTGTPMHPEMHKAAMAQLERFRHEWDKWMRGYLPVVKDTDVTDLHRQAHTLILFGDPGSNRHIADALAKLPIEWSKAKLNFGATDYDPRTHLPVLIQSSPWNPDGYVVLNSGHTFHEADFQGTNALLYPRLGDYAVVKPTPTAKDPAAFEVVTAGLFDEKWQFPKK